MKKIIDFAKANGLIPAIIQENKTGEVLMLGYMNIDAFRKTCKTRFVWFWSRKRKKLWLKGEKSGNKLKVVKMMLDCDKDTLLIKADMLGNNVCHQKRKSCFRFIQLRG